MAELLQTPRCEATGLPLLISPFVSREPGARYKEQSNYHHANSPESAEELQGITGRARRFSWGQVINVTVHDRYNRRYSGPELGLSKTDEFKEIVLPLAGVRPRNVLALEMNQNRVVELDDSDYATMYHPSRVHYQDAYHNNPARQRYVRTVIGRYLADYALSQDLIASFKEETIDQFLDPSTNERRRLELGNQFITDAIGVSIDQLIPTYTELVHEGYVIPGKYRSPRTVIGKFFTKQYFEDYHATVSERLRLAVNPV